jgi:hydrogenase maturation protease
MKGVDDRRPTTDNRLNDRQEMRDKRQEQGNIPSPVSCLRSPVSGVLSPALESVVSGQRSVVVIGYGNDLRGDDAVGPLAATAVAEWDVPGVQVLAVHQLTPELAEVLTAAELAIFVDACASAERKEVETQLIAPATLDTALGHTGDPRELLALTKALYGHCPAAWLITVPAQSFALGTALSPTAERGLAAALQELRALIAEHPGF